MSITPLPAAPSRSDAPDVFIAKADAWVVALANFVAEINAAGVINRPILTSGLPYYVRTDGNDANEGLSNTAGGAFLTIQAAVDVACALDFNGQTVTINIADGTYTTPVLVSRSWAGGGTLALVGNVGAPTNVLLTTNASDCVKVNAGLSGTLSLNGMRLRTTTSGVCLRNSGRGLINFTNVDFAVCPSYHILADTPGARISGIGNYSISGAAVGHLFAAALSEVAVDGVTVTITGTPSFSGAFASAQEMGLVESTGCTFSGSATGQRYNASTNGVIFTNGGGASYFPGNSAGATATGGQYA